MELWVNGVMGVLEWDYVFPRSVVRHSIVHAVLLDFLTHCDHTSRSVSPLC